MEIKKTRTAKTRIIRIIISLIIIIIIAYCFCNYTEQGRIWQIGIAHGFKNTEKLEYILFNDRDDKVRIDAVLALGEIRDDKSLKALMRYVKTQPWCMPSKMLCIRMLINSHNKTIIGELIDFSCTCAGADYDLTTNKVGYELNCIIYNSPRWEPKWEQGEEYYEQYYKDYAERIKEWWDRNKDYLYWNNSINRFIIDDEAMAAGIPTDEYHKTHPWPKEDKPK
jgi:hypothetical protein